ncbi:MAG TPA: aldehyde dehydrogenase family protein [Pyrinomonadaceae bacterium]|jgi:succinate-semialdehyde dehydrogenase/glutarate-semialdehyde dehydrogenase|nr:aldehyde dehydrogenase family protein [Pyrinomonadaceae bacterium]
MSIQTLSAPQTREIISVDPSTGEENGRVPLMDASEVAAAVSRARAAQPAWAKLSYQERARFILRAREIVLEELEQIATLISRETGKPTTEAISMEIVPTLDLMHYFAENMKKLLKRPRIGLGQYNFMARTSYIVYKPLGVVGIISPWNFPWATPLDEVVMALMAGNAVVVKPSELTPLTALRIADVFKKAQLPEGMVQIVTGDGSTGAALVDAGVNKIMFTGSVNTGKHVAETAAKHLTPVVLELGGKDPMIVLEDASLENAARAAIWGAFCNSGQACASIERCYVHESIAGKFIDLVVKETQLLKQDKASTEAIDIGAMTNERQLLIVEDHVGDAVAHGAKVRTGGHRLNISGGWFHEPTVVTGVDHSMKLMRDETFGPVLPIMTFKTDEEAIQLANDSLYGLTASVFTGDISRGKRLAEQIDAGTVMVNEVVYTHAVAQTPWGGVKQSGYGRTHGHLGLLEMVSAQHIHVNAMPGLADVWWFPYTKQAGKMFRDFARRFTTGSILTSSLLLPQIIRRLFEPRIPGK